MPDDAHASASSREPYSNQSSDSRINSGVRSLKYSPVSGSRATDVELATVTSCPSTGLKNHVGYVYVRISVPPPNSFMQPLVVDTPCRCDRNNCCTTSV